MAGCAAYQFRCCNTDKRLLLCNCIHSAAVQVAGALRGSECPGSSPMASLALAAHPPGLAEVVMGWHIPGSIAG